jgi:hypothetical protein
MQQATPAPGATLYRGIPERSPLFQAAPQATTTNVFQQRDREIQEQRRAQQQEQAAQERQIQQRQKQDRAQQGQQLAPAQLAPAPAPQLYPPQATQPQVAPPPRPRTDIRRAPPQPITPAEQR